MIGKLRCNVVMRDWYDELEYFYYLTGYDAQGVAMNKKTLHSMMYYLNKNTQYGNIDVHYNYVDIPDGYRNTIVQYCNNTDIMFRGVRIFIDVQMEDETMRIW